MFNIREVVVSDGIIVVEYRTTEYAPIDSVAIFFADTSVIKFGKEWELDPATQLPVLKGSSGAIYYLNPTPDEDIMRETGQWSDGVLTGPGSRMHSNGLIIKGTWSGKRIQGEGSIEYADRTKEYGTVDLFQGVTIITGYGYVSTPHQAGANQVGKWLIAKSGERYPCTVKELGKPALINAWKRQFQKDDAKLLFVKYRRVTYTWGEGKSLQQARDAHKQLRAHDTPSEPCWVLHRDAWSEPALRYAARYWVQTTFVGHMISPATVGCGVTSAAAVALNKKAMSGAFTPGGAIQLENWLQILLNTAQKDLGARLKLYEENCIDTMIQLIQKNIDSGGNVKEIWLASLILIHLAPVHPNACPELFRKMHRYITADLGPKLICSQVGDLGSKTDLRFLEQEPGLIFDYVARLKYLPPITSALIQCINGNQSGNSRKLAIIAFVLLAIDPQRPGYSKPGIVKIMQQQVSPFNKSHRLVGYTGGGGGGGGGGASDVAAKATASVAELLRAAAVSAVGGGGGGSSQKRKADHISPALGLLRAEASAPASGSNEADQHIFTGY